MNGIVMMKMTIYGWEIQKDSIEGNNHQNGVTTKNGEFMVSFSRNSSLSELSNLKKIILKMNMI